MSHTLIPRQTSADRDGEECILDPNEVIEIQGLKLTVSELLARGPKSNKTGHARSDRGQQLWADDRKVLFQ